MSPVLSFRPPRLRWCDPIALLLAATLGFSACGGGGGGDTPTTPNPPTGPAVLDQPFDALGSSSRSVSLAWAAPAEAARYDIERRNSAGGEFVRIATVDAASGAYLDSGLNEGASYSYRLAKVGGVRSETPAKTATTTDDEAVITERGSPLGEFSGRTLGAAGGTLASHDGAIQVVVPAGAFAADTATETQPVENMAPEARWDALRVRLAAAPQLPLLLKLRYDEQQDDEVDTLRIAVQRPLGDWTSLPLSKVDRTTRTLEARVPPEFLAAAGSTAATGVEFHVAQYVAMTLLPREARVKVGDSIEFVPWAHVRGYETNAAGCPLLPDGSSDCVLQPVLKARQLPLTNNKPGYERYWRVNFIEGGNATLGTIAPTGNVGARYTAPARVPNPATVRVVFHTAHTASGRVLNLSANVEIWDDAFNGTLDAIDGPSSEGTTLFARAQTRWELDPATANQPVKRYKGSGNVKVWATDPDCSAINFSPDSSAIDTSSQMVALEVDERSVPFTYKLTLVTVWTSTFSATCNRGSASVPGMTAGWGWQVEGTVANDGQLIVGEQVTEDGYKLSWRLTR